VLGHGGSGDGHSVRELVHRPWPGQEPLEDPTTGRVPERPKRHERIGGSVSVSHN
jgi:hypothetical protein